MNARRVAKFAIHAGLVLLLGYWAPIGCAYMYSRNDEFHIVNKVKDEITDIHLAILFLPGQLADSGWYNVIASSNEVSGTAGYPFFEQIVFSMKEGAVPTISYQDSCYAIKTKDAKRPIRLKSGWYATLFGGAVDLKDGDHWRETIDGKSLCFIFVNRT